MMTIEDVDRWGWLIDDWWRWLMTVIDDDEWWRWLMMCWSWPMVMTDDNSLITIRNIGNSIEYWNLGHHWQCKECILIRKSKSSFICWLYFNLWHQTMSDEVIKYCTAAPLSRRGTYLLPLLLRVEIIVLNLRFNFILDQSDIVCFLSKDIKSKVLWLR